MSRSEFLRHYASPYYDPEKAHEYYMQHRVLKGRQSTADLNDEGKEVWAYTKNQITEEKKAVNDYVNAVKDFQISAARQRAEEARKSIKGKLSQYKKINAFKFAKAKKRIAYELKTTIAAARKAYKATKENTNAANKDLYQAEYDKILSEYQAVKKKNKRKSRKKQETAAAQ